MRKISEETRKKISEANRGKIPTEETRLKISLSLKKYFLEHPEKIKSGFPPGYNPNTPEHREKNRAHKIGKSNPMWGRRGKLAPNWRGGITKQNSLIRGSFEYREWRKMVFERDNHTCQICLVRGGYLHADHIKQFAYYPKLRFDVSNGRTLCRDCHKKTPTYKKRIR